MRHLKIIVRHAALLIVLIVAACSSSGKAADDNPATSGNDAASAVNAAAVPVLPVNAEGVAVVARVNGVDITQPQFDRALSRRGQEVASANPAALQAIVLDTLIEQSVIEQVAAANQIIVSDAEVDAQFQSFVTEAGSAESWQEWLNQNQYTEDEFRLSLRSSLITARVRDAITQGIAAEPLQVRARHILVPAEAEATQILQRLQAGEDFVALAAEFSHDVTTKDQGGDLGWFADGELLQPTITATAFALEPGQIAGPVPTSLGYHIIQTLEKAARPLPPERYANLTRAMFERWIAAQRQGAVIETFL